MLIRIMNTSEHIALFVAAEFGTKRYRVLRPSASSMYLFAVSL